MKNIMRDQLVKCMETHNKNVCANMVDYHNEMTMRACVVLLLKNGEVPVISVKDICTMKKSQFKATESKMLTENCGSMLYESVSFMNGDSVENYIEIAMPQKILRRCAC